MLLENYSYLETSNIGIHWETSFLSHSSQNTITVSSNSQVTRVGIIGSPQIQGTYLSISLYDSVSNWSYFFVSLLITVNQSNYAINHVLCIYIWICFYKKNIDRFRYSIRDSVDNLSSFVCDFTYSFQSLCIDHNTVLIYPGTGIFKL